MANILGIQTVGTNTIYSIDTNPSLGVGLDLPIGVMAIAKNGAGIFYKVGAFATNWANTKYAPPTIYGNYLTENYNRASLGSNYSTTSITANIVSNKLEVSGTASTFNQYISLTNNVGNNNSTMVEQYTQKMRFTNALNTDGGVWVGRKTTSQYNPVSMYCFINTTNGGSRGFLSLWTDVTGGTLNFVSVSATALVFTNGDIIELVMSRNFFTWTLTANNITTSTSVTLTYSTTPEAGNYYENVGLHSLGVYGTFVHKIISHTIDYNCYKNNDYAFVGNSITAGAINPVYANRWCTVGMANLLKPANDFNVFASPGALMAESLKNIKEVIAFNPKGIVIFMGTNEVGTAYGSSNFATDYANYCAQIRTAGISITHCLIPPSGIVGWYANVPTYNAVISNEANANKELLLDTYTRLLGAAPPVCNVAYFSPDFIHPNASGHLLLSEIFQNNFVTTLNGTFYVTNKSGLKYATGGKIWNDFVDVGNATTLETDLNSYTLPINSLSNNGETIEAIYSGRFISSGTATRQLKIYFGGGLLFDTGALTLSLSSAWVCYLNIVRVSATVIRYNASLTTQGAALAAYTMSGEITGLDLVNTNIIKITGTSAGVGASTNDIILNTAKGYWFGTANN